MPSGAGAVRIAAFGGLRRPRRSTDTCPSLRPLALPRKPGPRRRGGAWVRRPRLGGGAGAPHLGRGAVQERLVPPPTAHRANRSEPARLPRVRRRGGFRRRLPERAPPRPAPRGVHALRVRRDRTRRGGRKRPGRPREQRAALHRRLPALRYGQAALQPLRRDLPQGLADPDGCRARRPHGPRVVRRLRHAHERDRGRRGSRPPHPRAQRVGHGAPGRGAQPRARFTRRGGGGAGRHGDRGAGRAGRSGHVHTRDPAPALEHRGPAALHRGHGDGRGRTRHGPREGALRLPRLPLRRQGLHPQRRPHPAARRRQAPGDGSASLRRQRRRPAAGVVVARGPRGQLRPPRPLPPRRARVRPGRRAGRAGVGGERPFQRAQDPGDGRHHHARDGPAELQPPQHRLLVRGQRDGLPAREPLRGGGEGHRPPSHRRLREQRRHQGQAVLPRPRSHRPEHVPRLVLRRALGVRAEGPHHALHLRERRRAR